MGTNLTPAEKKALVKLGHDATREHRACLKLANDALHHACLAGDYLRQAKEAVPHGEWSTWLEEHFSEASERSAQAYMQISSHWTELQQNRSDAADLSIRGALKALAKPREPNPLAALPPEQQEACQADYREECERTGEEPTADGLRATVDLYQADNEPYEPPDGEIDAPEADPTETPAPLADAPVRTPASPCEVFWPTIEKQIDGWLTGNPEVASVLFSRMEAWLISKGWKPL